MEAFKYNYNGSEYIFKEFVEKNIANRGKIKNVTDVTGLSYHTEAYKSVFSFGTDFVEYVNKHNSVKQYKGYHYSPEFLLDFDAPKVKGNSDQENLDLVRQEVLNFIAHLHETYKILVNDVMIFFSGNRGFHIVINRANISSCIPSENFAQMDKLVAKRLTASYKYADLSIYKIVGLIRIANSLHPKSNLYKIPLTLSELRELPISGILQLAERPRFIEKQESGDSLPSAEFTELFKLCEQQLLIESRKVSKKITEAVEYDESNDLNYSSNIKDVSQFLSQKIDNYPDWFLCGLACASLGEEGREYFLTLSQNPNYPEDTETILNKEYNDLLQYYDRGIEKRVRIGTMFFIAKSYGYVYNNNYSYSDEGNRDRFIDLNRNVIRFNTDSGFWVHWNEQRWKEDKEGVLSKDVDKVDASLVVKAKNISDKNKKAAMLWHIRRTRSRYGREAIIALAKVDSRMIMRNYMFDAHKELFNCKNCTLKLNPDGSYTENKFHKEHYITKQANAKYDPNAECPNWLKFINLIFDNDQAVIEFVQKAVGYSMTGFTDEDCFFFLNGEGQNGKSTFAETIKEIFGEYAAKAKIDVIMKGKGEATGMDVARLVGARFVVCSEANAAMSFDEAKLKDLTGGDTISARYLYKEIFEFIPEFKLWMYANSKPRVKGTDYGIQRRYRIIAFNVKIPAEEKKLRSEVFAVLRNEYSGILNWMLKGYRLYRTEGLTPPEAVKLTTNGYFENMDIVSRFIEECVKEDFTGKTKVMTMYNAYTNYCKNVGQRAWSMVSFNEVFWEKMSEKRIDKKRIGSGGYFWIGVILKSDDNGFFLASTPQVPPVLPTTAESDLSDLELPKEV